MTYFAKKLYYYDIQLEGVLNSEVCPKFGFYTVGHRYLIVPDQLQSDYLLSKATASI